MNNSTRVDVLSNVLLNDVAGADGETPRCTTVTGLALPWRSPRCRNVEMHYIEPHQLNVLLTGFADGREMRGSSTRVLETTPVFPGSGTIYLLNI